MAIPCTKTDIGCWRTHSRRLHLISWEPLHASSQGGYQRDVLPKGRDKTISCGHHPQFLEGEHDHDRHEGIIMILGKRVYTMILVKNFESNLVDGDVSERAASAEDDRTRNHTRLQVITANEQLWFYKPHHT